MSLANADTLNPRVHFNKILRGPANITARELEARLMRFVFTDDKKTPSKIEMDFDNSDGVIVNLAVLLVGLKIRLNFGYDALRSRTFDLVVYKVKGTMVRGPNTVSPAPTSAGVVTMEGTLYSAKVHKSPRYDIGTWKNTKLSQVVRQIARSMGYRETKIFVEPRDANGNPEPVLEEVIVPDDMTYAVFLQNKARERGFKLDIGKKEFHFHSEKWLKTPKEQIEYFYGPDLLEFGFDGDWKLNMARVSSKGLDLKSRKFFIDVQTARRGVASVKYNNARKRPSVTVDDVIRAIPEKKREAAARRMATQQRRKWAIKLTLVGNPRVLRGMVMTLSNFGPLIDGDWYVKGCKHTFDGSGYTTELGLRAKRKGGGACPRRFKFFVDPVTGRRGVAAFVCRISKKNKGRKGRRKKSDKARTNNTKHGPGPMNPAGI